MKYGDKTRFKDRNGDTIYIGDVVNVEEHPGKYVGGSIDYEGVIEWEDSRVVAVYYDLGEREAMPLSMFPVKGRRILKAWQRKEYWRSLMLGAEPPKRLYMRDRYHEQNEVHEAVDQAGLGTNYGDYAFMEDIFE